jgi:dimethylhistidine N-methyltransferase
MVMTAADDSAVDAASGSPQFLQLYQADADAIRAELAEGLAADAPQIAFKFLYDALGSRLFDAITELPEYYLTRTESAIFSAEAESMATTLPAGAVWLDLGAGNCAKAARFFRQARVAAYLPVDISVDYLRDTLRQLQLDHPALRMLGLGMDFSSGFSVPSAAERWLTTLGLQQAPRVLFYPGSSIGNFAPAAALQLLRDMYAVCAGGGPGGGVFIGVDRVKPKAVLDPAYDDPLGVTAAFNRNLLLNVNRRLGSDFDPAGWRHRGFFNEAESRIEMHLNAIGSQTVQWPGGRREFLDGQGIHTENSYKWTEAAFTALLESAGFRVTRHWQDERGWFSLFWAQA